jgi:choline-sulfatase
VSIAALALVPVALADAPAPPAPGTSWSVLLVTVDCLRPDHMSLYGYERPTTPLLEEWSREAVVFDRAFGTSAWTSPGVVSLLTGWYPPVHGQNSHSSWFDPEISSPLRLLGKAGLAVTGRTREGPTYADLGLDTSFEPLFAPEDILATLARRNTRFFAWVHLRSTHLPYRPSPASAALFAPSGYSSPGFDAIRTFNVVFHRDIDSIPATIRHPGVVSFSEADIPAIRGQYDATVRDTDEQIDRLIETMRDLRLLDRTIVGLTADHGEERLDHGWVGHASTSWDAKLYDELVRVPLVVRLPDRSARGRVEALVQQVDVMPTLLDLLGVDASALDAPMQGRSLVPLMRGETDHVRDLAFADTTRKGWTTPEEEVPIRLSMVRSLDRKLIRTQSPAGSTFQAFDLASDPGEAHDLWTVHPQAFSDLVDQLNSWDAENQETAARLVLPAARRHLEALRAAVAAGGPATAAENLARIERMYRTWSLEALPFTEMPPWSSEWATIRREAARRVMRAMREDRP